MTITFLGDFMPSGDQSARDIKISRSLNKLLNRCDLRIATLETAVGDYCEISDSKMDKGEVAVWSKKEDLQKLHDLNINVVTLANNHACDCGFEALIRLLSDLHNQGIETIGAGANLSEAMQPAIYEKDGESIAIIGCCKDDPKSLGHLPFAGTNSGGLYRLDENLIIPQIRSYKQHFNYVAVLVHWGVEHKWLPELEDVELSKKMIDAGADIIVGGHPHHIQPKIDYKNRPVFYSLGNFFFPDFCLDNISNVYYPDEEELKRLPLFDWMAPDKRNFSMRYFWKYYGRIGMIATVNTDDFSKRSQYSISLYKQGRLSISHCQILHKVILAFFSRFVGKNESKVINKRITRIQYLFEYKILALLFKRYQFFKYMNYHNW